MSTSVRCLAARDGVGSSNVSFVEIFELIVFESGVELGGPTRCSLPYMSALEENVTSTEDGIHRGINCLIDSMKVKFGCLRSNVSCCV